MRINLIFKTAIIFFALFIQVSCSSQQTKTAVADFPVKPIIIPDNKDDGWGGDIRLSITNISENDTTKIFKAISIYNNKDLGLLVFIPKAAEDDKGFGKAGITLKSIGEKSDNLIQLLTTLYKQKNMPGAKFVSSISGTYVNLSKFAKSVAGNASDDALNISEYKLFFESKDDEAELFLNINTQEQWLELKEKDPEYRPLLIKLLSR
jgi:hypothetical protein